MITHRFDIDGMSCGSCVGRVDRAFMAVAGVETVSVNLAQSQAVVTAADHVTTQQLTAASGNAGYPAVEVQTADTIKASDRQAKEATHLQRMTVIAAVLTAPVFVMEMGGHIYPPIHHAIAGSIGQQASWMIQFVLTTLVLMWPGQQFYTKGIPALLRGAPDMNALVGIGTFAAWAYSVVATFMPTLLPSGTAAVYYESAAVIVTLILLGRMLEARAKGRTGDAINKLVRLRPKTAMVQRDGHLVTINIDELISGDLVQLRPGERVAVDGVVQSGQSYVDESMMTGESIAVAKSTGDQVIGGTVNTTGAMVVRATSVGEDSVLSQIITMVSDAQAAKLPIQDIVNRVTLWFVPVVLALAVVTVAVWLVFGPEPALPLALVSGVSVLIIACPCAMGLATPTSIMVGTGRAAEMGVLFRQGDALQGLSMVKTVAFDKTGTLTKGTPELTDFIAAEAADGDAVLRDLAAVEAKSEHPIADAVVRAAKGPLPTAQSVEAITGLGVVGEVAGRRVAIGAKAMMAHEGIATDNMIAAFDALGREGKTPFFGAIDGVIAAVIAVSDPLKDETAQTLQALRKLGINIAMITGDQETTANAIGSALGINQILAETLPADKVSALKTLAGPVAFVGDGINDGPALAQADVGIAIGTGTDIAVEAADVVLMSGDLRGVANALAISTATMRNIKENLFWAFGYNVLLIPVAAGVLFPVAGIMLSPAIAAGAMALSSVFVLSNALRLRWTKGAVRV